MSNNRHPHCTEFFHLFFKNLVFQFPPFEICGTFFFNFREVFAHFQIPPCISYPWGIGEISWIFHQLRVNGSYLIKGLNRAFQWEDKPRSDACLFIWKDFPLAKDFPFLRGDAVRGVLWRCALRRGIVDGYVGQRYVWRGGVQ